MPIPDVCPHCHQSIRQRYGRFELDTATKVLLVDGEVVHLTGSEFKIFCLMFEYPGIVFSREKILDMLGDEGRVFDRVIDKHVNSMRKKLPENCIETVFGFGYRFKGYV